MNVVEMLLVGSIIEMQQRLQHKFSDPWEKFLFQSEFKRAEHLIDLGDDVLCMAGIGPEVFGPYTVEDGFVIFV